MSTRSRDSSSPVLEHALAQHPAVAEVMVRPGVEGPTGGSLSAHVVPNEGAGGLLRRALGVEGSPEFEGISLHEPSPDLLVAQHNPRETDFLYQEIFVDGVYARHGIELEDGARVVDVGANIGMFALFVARHVPTARIICIEPIAELCRAIRANAVIHDANIRVHACALGRQPGQLSMTFYKHNSVMSSYLADAEQDRGVVRSYLTNEEHALDPARMDELIRERMHAEQRVSQVSTLREIVLSEGLDQIDLLKIDVEKAELEVLAGIDDATWNLVRQVVIEAHAVGGRLDSIRAELEQRGFRVTIEQDARLANTGCHNVYGIRPRPVDALPRRCAARQAPPFPTRKALADALFQHLQASAPLAPAVDEIILVRELGDDSAQETRRQRSSYRRRGSHPLTTETERALGKLWCEILRLERVSADTDFFEAGGKSLSAIRLVVRVEELFGGPVLSPDTLFNSGRLCDVAKAIDAAVAGATLP